MAKRTKLNDSPDNSRMARDLHQLLYERYRTVSRDWFDTAARADLSDGDIMASIMTVMLGELIRAAIHLKVDRDRFIEICEHAYDTQRRESSGPTRTA
jgi:hypothetical protein